MVKFSSYCIISCNAIPVGLCLIFGNEVVNTVLNYAPDWLMGGLKLAGAILPVVGIAILLHYFAN